MKRFLRAAGALMLLACLFGLARADYTIKDGNGLSAVVKAFVCETSKICSAHVLINSSGAEISPATAGGQTTTNTALGAPGESACSADSGSCSHNALLQRIAQRLTSLINGVFRTTYHVAGNVAPAASATDVITLAGSASKTVRVTRVVVSGTLASSATGNVQLVKRSTANSGGTSSALTAVSLDSSNASASAVARSYSANPTLGNTVGTLGYRAMFYNTASAVPDRVVFDLGDNYKQAAILRGTSEVLAINVNGASPTSFAYDVEWTEE
jgi:hypothetical protein